MKELLTELVAAGERMRTAQRRHLRTSFKSDLYAAIEAERAFDAAIAKCKDAVRKQ